MWHLESLSGKFRYRNQTNILILSWYNFSQKSYLNQIPIRKNRKYPAGHPILILSMLTSGPYGCPFFSKSIAEFQLHWWPRKLDKCWIFKSEKFLTRIRTYFRFKHFWHERSRSQKMWLGVWKCDSGAARPFSGSLFNRIFQFTTGSGWDWISKKLHWIGNRYLIFQTRLD